jgi:hypothetical protein
MVNKKSNRVNVEVMLEKGGDKKRNYNFNTKRKLCQGETIIN